MRIRSVPVTLNLLLNGSNTLTHDENTYKKITYKGLFLKRNVSFDIKFMFQFANSNC